MADPRPDDLVAQARWVAEHFNSEVGAKLLGLLADRVEEQQEALAALSPDGGPVLLVDGRVVAVACVAWLDPDSDRIYRTPAPWRHPLWTEYSDA